MNHPAPGWAPSAFRKLPWLRPYVQFTQDTSQQPVGSLRAAPGSQPDGTGLQLFKFHGFFGRTVRPLGKKAAFLFLETVPKSPTETRKQDPEK